MYAPSSFTIFKEPRATINQKSALFFLNDHSYFWKGAQLRRVTISSWLTEGSISNRSRFMTNLENATFILKETFTKNSGKI